MATATDTVIHEFERAGLGKAPFKLVGVDRRPHSCEYCYTAIMERCHIMSADGNVFIVGNVCVGKTGDAGLKRVTDAAVKKMRMEAEEERIANVSELLKTSNDIRSKLAGNPHPKLDGKTALDYAEWMLENAGHSGRVKIARMVEKLLRGDDKPESKREYNTASDAVSKIDASANPVVGASLTMHATNRIEAARLYLHSIPAIRNAAEDAAVENNHGNKLNEFEHHLLGYGGKNAIMHVTSEIERLAKDLNAVDLDTVKTIARIIDAKRVLENNMTVRHALDEHPHPSNDAKKTMATFYDEVIAEVGTLERKLKIAASIERCLEKVS